MGLLTVPTAGRRQRRATTRSSSRHRPLRLRRRTASQTGGGTIGVGSQFDDDDFFRDGVQFGYNLTLG